MMKFDPQNNSNFTLTLNNLYGEPQVSSLFFIRIIQENSQKIKL